jgi:hypothetical protein
MFWLMEKLLTFSSTLYSDKTRLSAWTRGRAIAARLKHIPGTDWNETDRD